MKYTVVIGGGEVLAVVVVVVVVWWWGWYKKQQWEQVGRITVIDNRDDGHFLSHSRFFVGIMVVFTISRPMRLR